MFLIVYEEIEVMIEKVITFILLCERRNQMKTGELTVTTQIIGSNDNQNTYEVRRTWDENGKTAIVIELYPTISVSNIDKMDLSTMHLMNHTKELGWGSVRIVNLYSTVFDAKPRTSELSEDNENMEYLKTIFSQKDIKEHDIVIAWGSGLSNHLLTNKKKLEILELLIKKKLDGLVTCIEPEYMNDITQQGVHPLFLGLHHAKEEWCLSKYDVKGAISRLKKIIDKPKEKAEEKKEEKEDCSALRRNL